MKIQKNTAINQIVIKLSEELCFDHGTVNIINSTFYSCICDLGYFGHIARMQV